MCGAVNLAKGLWLRRSQAESGRDGPTQRLFC